MADQITIRWLAALIAMAVAGSVFAHPFHVTLSEATVNRETNRLEVAMRVFPEDLERALEHKFERPIDIERDEDADARIAEYVRSVFRLRDPDVVRGESQSGGAIEDDQPEMLSLHWVGKEVEVRHAWLYFEIELDREIEGLELSVSAMFAVEPMQENTVQLRDGDRRVTMRCVREKPWVLVSFVDEDQEPAASDHQP